jgi:DNA-binding transcriptional LysR family regulator
MIDLNRATTFVRVVETGGFTRAAEQLGLPASSVSRSVAKLEDDLGVTLLERTTRKVTLTDAGKAFFERARDALAGLEEANNLALDAAREIHGVVRIAVPPHFGGKLGTIFSAFAVANPKVRIEVTFTTRGMELVGDLVDIGVVVGRLPDSSLITRRLGESTDKLYASPAYVREHGQPRKASELSAHDAVLTQAVAGEGRWELTGPKGTEHVHVHGRMVGDHLQFTIDAAIAGLGIALLPVTIGERGVRDGALVAILPRFSTELTLHLLSSAGRHIPRRVALLREHLTAELVHRCTNHG